MTAPPASASQPSKFPSAAKLLAVIVISAIATIWLLRSSTKKHRAETAAPLTSSRQHSAELTDQPKTAVSIEAVQAPSAVTDTASTVSVESLETLAATDPARALTLALAEKDDAQRDVFLQSVLRGWARSAPDAAADWAWTHQDAIEQGHAFAAVFNGTQQNPEAALRLARRLSTEHPEEAWSFGRYLVYSFAQVGHFAQAADFAAAAHPDHRVDLLTAIYHPWGCQQPEKALQSAIAFEDPLRQNAAFHAVIGGWAQTNPQSLTEAAYKFPEGHDRSLALVTGLRSWIEKDPSTAEAWVKTHKLTAEESTRALEE
ncbi:MAG: hypothetical protein QM715_14865 [Nibricoccus sp.]